MAEAAELRPTWIVQLLVNADSQVRNDDHPVRPRRRAAEIDGRDLRK